MKILIDEMYEGLDEKLKEKGFIKVESVKKLVNSGKKLQSDFSVLNYARETKSFLTRLKIKSKLTHNCEINKFCCLGKTRHCSRVWQKRNRN